MANSGRSRRGTQARMSGMCCTARVGDRSENTRFLRAPRASAILDAAGNDIVRPRPSKFHRGRTERSSPGSCCSSTAVVTQPLAVHRRRRAALRRCCSRMDPPGDRSLDLLARREACTSRRHRPGVSLARDPSPATMRMLDLYARSNLLPFTVAGIGRRLDAASLPARAPAGRVSVAARPVDRLCQSRAGGVGLDRLTPGGCEPAPCSARPRRPSRAGRRYALLNGFATSSSTVPLSSQRSSQAHRDYLGFRGWDVVRSHEPLRPPARPFDAGSATAALPRASLEPGKRAPRRRLEGRDVARGRSSGPRKPAAQVTGAARR